MDRRSSRGLRLRSLPLAIALALAGLLAAATTGHARAATRPDVVRLEGVLGARDLPAALMGTFLVVDKLPVPFAVTAARRFTPFPEEGVGILMPMGPGAPRIRLIGPKRLLGPLRTAPVGTPVVLLGNLTPSLRLFQVIESSLTPVETPAPKPLNGASTPRE